jgi:hypothetical protein
MYLFRLIYLVEAEEILARTSLSFVSETMVSAGLAGVHVQPVLEKISATGSSC